MKAWFGGLSRREQWVFGLGGAAIVLVILYSVLWAPLAAGVEKLSADNEKAAEELAWMYSAAATVNARKAMPAGSAEQSLSSLVDSSLPHYQLAMQRFQPIGSNAAQLWLEDAPVGQVLAWLSHLEVNFGMRLASVALTPSDKPGIVQIRVRIDQP